MTLFPGKHWGPNWAKNKKRAEKRAARFYESPPPADALHYHVTELRGAHGVTLCEVRTPCSKCDWGH